MKRLSRWVGTLGLVAATACSTLVASSAEARPAMWKVSDADTTVYLFGTIHMLPKSMKWRTANFDRAVASADELVVETVIDEKNPMELMGLLAQMAVSPNLPPIAQRVKPERRAALAAAIAKSKMPAAAFDRLETWAAAFLLLGQQFGQLGVDGDAGVESVLKSQFRTSAKPVDQLETNREQLSYFDGLSEAAQRDFLDGVLQDSKGLKSEFGAMLKSWSSGDVAGIAKSFNADLTGEPELVDALLTRRNANWEKWVAKRLDRPGTSFVAVGAGHLAGDKSLIALLQRAGMKVERVQ